VLIMLVSCVALPVCAEEKTDVSKYVITDKQQKSEYLSAFEGSVNRIKTDMPKCTVTTSHTLNNPLVGTYDPAAGFNDKEVLDPMAQKWIGWIVDACFKDGAGLANTLFSTIFKDEYVPEQKVFQFGEKRTNRLPVSGEDYLCAVEDSDLFTMTVQTKGGTKLHPETAKTYTTLNFYDTKLDDREGSAVSKCFNLTDGDLNPIVISAANSSSSSSSESSGNNVLKDVKFNDFYFSGAYVQSVANSDGEIEKYSTDINYTFILSLQDFIRLVSATAGFDFLAVARAIYGVIIENTTGSNVSVDDILKERCLKIIYNIHMDITDFTWANRYFGDVDNEDNVTIKDARYALRHAIGLQTIRNQASLMYTDVDFDGKITVSDARLILRMAIKLDEKMTKVPDGKKITIVEYQEEPTPAEEEEQDKPTPDDPSSDNPSSDNPSSGTDPEKPGVTDISQPVSDFVQTIFDIINEIKGMEGVAQGGLDDIINEVKK